MASPQYITYILLMADAVKHQTQAADCWFLCLQLRGRSHHRQPIDSYIAFCCQRMRERLTITMELCPKRHRLGKQVAP